MRRRRRERPRPMPTDEDKKKAQIKAAGADPLVWAMKSVDEKFPDSREKNSEMVEEVEDELEDEEIEEIAEENTEIEAEGQLAMPTDEGVITMEVKPMRQNTDKAIEESPKEKPQKEVKEQSEVHESKKVKGKAAKKALKDEAKIAPAAQVKLTALESKQKKIVAGFIALLVLALGSIVFAVVAIVNQKNATETLEHQIISSTGFESDSVNDGYINLKDWKMKIKVISGLEHVSFDYDNDEYSSVMIWAAKKNTEVNYGPDFAKQSKNTNPLGIVTRVPRYERAAAGRLIWYDDFYNYYYQGPTGEPEAEESEMSWWVESYLLVKDMLTDADNYIKYDDNAIGNK